MIRFRHVAQVAALILAVAFGVAPGQAQAGANEGVLNPNLADGGELLDLGLEQATVDAILEDRPFLDMLTLDALLEGDLDEAHIFNASFIKGFIGSLSSVDTILPIDKLEM